MRHSWAPIPSFKVLGINSKGLEIVADLENKLKGLKTLRLWLVSEKY